MHGLTNFKFKKNITDFLCGDHVHPSVRLPVCDLLYKLLNCLL